MRSVDADSDGPLPDSIAEVAERNNASAMLLMPTFQNPTTTTVSSRRRDQIAEVCAHRNLWAIEDCVVSDILDSPPATICAQIPDRTLLVGSLSKSVCVSLRFGFLRCLPELVARAEKNLQSLTLANSPLIMVVRALIIDDGRADELRHRVGAEIEARYRIVRQVFNVLPSTDFQGVRTFGCPFARGILARTDRRLSATGHLGCDHA